jgi:hypothetical protein
MVWPIGHISQHPMELFGSLWLHLEPLVVSGVCTCLYVHLCVVPTCVSTGLFHEGWVWWSQNTKRKESRQVGTKHLLQPGTAPCLFGNPFFGNGVSP